MNDDRPVVRCTRCGLTQYLHGDGRCARCHRPLFLLEAVGEDAGPEPPVVDSWGARISARVSELRVAAKITQQALADRMHVVRTYVSRVENGVIVPTLASIEKFAKGLRVSPADVVASDLEVLEKCLPQLTARQRQELLNAAAVMSARGAAGVERRERTLGDRR